MNYHNLLKKIIKDGKIVTSKGASTKEVIRKQLIVNPRRCIYAYPNSGRPIELICEYLRHELAWYFSGNRKADAIKSKASIWAKIINSDNTLNSNYGHLVFYNKTEHPSMGKDIILTPYEWAKECLIEDPNSRQAVISYNTGAFNFIGNRDYICTQHQAFLIRDNKLICNIALRSSDAIYGLTYNMPWWSIVAKQLHLDIRKYNPDINLGDIHVNIYSSHIYEKHWRIVENMIKESPQIFDLKLLELIPLGMSMEWYYDNLNKYIKIDRKY